MEREIDGLLNKLTDLERSVGGNSSEKAKKTISSGDAFIGLKNSMAERLHNVKHILQKLYENRQSKKNRNPKDLIKSQQEIREEIRQLESDQETLNELLQKNLKKSKLSRDELELRKEVVAQYANEISHVKERSTDAYMRSPTGSSGRNRFSPFSPPQSPSIDSFGTMSPTEQEAMTNKQYADLSRVELNDREMDETLDEIGSGVEELGALARGINHEIVKQNVMLEGLEERIDKAQSHVVNVNTKMKETLGKVGRSGDKCMMDFICLVLLLGILAVVYNLAS